VRKIAVVMLVMLLASAVYGQGGRFRDFANTSPKPGENAPDFKGVDKKGDEVSLSQYKGKKHLVLIFGAIT